MSYEFAIWMSLGAAFIAAMIYTIAQRYSGQRETKYLQMLAVFTMVWAAIVVIDAPMDDLTEKVILMKIKFLAAPFIPVMVFGLLCSHGRKDNWLTSRNIALLSIVPAITFLLAMTVEYQGWFLHGFSVGQDGSLYTLQCQFGPWYWFYLFYSYVLMATGAIVLLASAWGANALYRKQAVVMLSAFMFPLAMDLLVNIGIIPSTGVDLTPSAFAISGVLLTWGMFRYRILDVLPIARSEVVENMTDILLVTDMDGKLVDHNRAAMAFLPKGRWDRLGIPIQEVAPFGEEFAARFTTEDSFRAEVTLGSGGDRKVYEASVMLVVVNSRNRARVLLLRDITERKRIEEALHASNAKLGLLSSITRHDLLNKLSVMDGYVTLARRTDDLEKRNAYLEKFDQSAAMARSIINFTKDYERMGLAAPAWHSVDSLVAKAAGDLDLRGAQVRSEVPGLQVWADGMIAKAFYNLIENSLRHGGKVTIISVHGEEIEGGYRLVYQDDGVGISKEDHPRIFERGYGKNTGLGLFLVREVLAITSISITENGEEGKGARFEILLPPGTYRFEVPVDLPELMTASSPART